MEAGKPSPDRSAMGLNISLPFRAGVAERCRWQEERCGVHSRAWRDPGPHFLSRKMVGRYRSAAASPKARQRSQMFSVRTPEKNHGNGPAGRAQFYSGDRVER